MGRSIAETSAQRRVVTPFQDQIPWSIQSSDVINGQLVPVVRSEAYAPTAWGPVPGQASGFAPVPTVPPAVSVASFGVMGSQAPGFSSNLGGAPPNSNSVPGAGADSTGNSAAAAAAGLFPWNWKLSPLPMALGLLLIALIGLRVFHWK